MKRITLAALCLAIALPTLAADNEIAKAAAGRRPADLPPLIKSFAEMLQELTTAQGRGPLRTTPNVVLEGAEYAFVFPIAGSGAGGGGTFFSTETTILNRLSRAQDVAFFFFPIGGGAANCTRPSVRKRLEGGTLYLYSDFVPDVFGTSGFGAVIVMGVTSSGQPDTTARIDGNSRIWTPQPGTNGTASQNFPAVSLAMPAGPQTAFGLRLDEFYRTNWGIFNYDVVARTFDISVLGFRGSTDFSVTIDACSIVQQGIPGGPYGSFLLTMSPRDGRGLFFSYGSSVDNALGDAWSVIARSN